MIRTQGATPARHGRFPHHPQLGPAHGQDGSVRLGGTHRLGARMIHGHRADDTWLVELIVWGGRGAGACRVSPFALRRTAAKLSKATRGGGGEGAAR